MALMLPYRIFPYGSIMVIMLPYGVEPLGLDTALIRPYTTTVVDFHNRQRMT
jgi:hypothetical protein